MTFLTLVITRFESKSDFAVNIKSCKKTLAEKSLDNPHMSAASYL